MILFKSCTVWLLILDSHSFLFLTESVHLRSFCFRVWVESSGVISEEAFTRQNAG